MPLHWPFQFKPNAKSTYDLAARANDMAKSRRSADFADEHERAQVHGISIATQANDAATNCTIPDQLTTKSLATDVIQLTRFKIRRPTIEEQRVERKSSFRNMFLGVPEVGGRRRFSQDIRATSKAMLAAKCAALNIQETKRVLMLQVFVPFLLSGFGNVAAGLFLNWAQKWSVFRQNTVFYILLATVMAFKTNLEATLAARLSTCSNLASMRGWRRKLEAFAGNLALVETQSVLCSLMASCLVISFYKFVLDDEGTSGAQLDLSLGLRLLATCMSAICLNELLSSIVILSVVELSERAGVNPDNVSTLIGAMFGDFSSVLFTSVTAQLLHSMRDHPNCNWLYGALILGPLMLLPGTLYYAARNTFTKGMFLGTHIPLALAVLVATLSGLVFEHAVQSFARIVIYQAVVNGVSVNLMAVQASRISTYLQQLNSLDPTRARQYANKCSPFEALYAQDMNASVARWLIALCVPAMSVYLCFIFLVAPCYVDITIYLVICCLISVVVQVAFIQCLTYLVTPISWKLDWDPDNVVIPILMSISDCSGNAILLTAFLFLRHISDPNSLGHEETRTL